MSARKPFNDRAGYVASLRSGKRLGWVVIYKAVAQGMDPKEGGEYAVVCETHASIARTSSVAKARDIMKACDFCEACNAPDAPPKLREDYAYYASEQALNETTNTIREAIEAFKHGVKEGQEAAAVFLKRAQDLYVEAMQLRYDASRHVKPRPEVPHG